MFRRIAARLVCCALALSMGASQAFALSCARPSLEGSFKYWAEAPETYYIGSGTLTPLSPLPDIPSPGVPNFGEAPELRAVYRFDGEMIWANYTSPLSHVVWLRVECLGPWCGQFPAAGTKGVLAFKQLPDLTLEASFSACPGSLFLDPNGDVLRRVQSCIANGTCPPSNGQVGAGAL